MYFKTKAEILPSFQPYENFQMAAGYLIGHTIHPHILWLVSFFNGSTAVGLAFGHLYRYLPGSSGASRGLVFGLCCWLGDEPVGISADRARLICIRNRTGPVARRIFSGDDLNI